MSKKETQLKSNGWEIKNRTYFLRDSTSPLTLTIPSKHTKKHPLLWFDKETGIQKELRYATNQASVFVDEQKGEATMGHITFRDGTLTVPKEEQALQHLLSLYHPLLNTKYKEHKPQDIAVDQLEDLNYEIDALIAAREIDIDHAEAIMRVEIGSKVNSMSSKELKRDLLLFAKNNPALFLELANDENVQLRNFGIKAAENNIIVLSQDQRDFRWPNTDRKIMTVPFDENAYSALAAFFKTDEGVDVYKSIEKKMN